jgi:penicillin-binding protein 1A
MATQPLHNRRFHPPRSGPPAVWLLALALVAAPFVLSACGSRRPVDVERLRSYQPGGATVLYDRDGRPFADLAPVDRVLVELDDLPPHVPAAFVAVEDKRFFRHGGVDVWRVGGAIFHNVKQGGMEEGFSTITMQLARSVFADQIPLRERNVQRKWREMQAALAIEKRFSKKEILELYLNHVYFGKGAVGIQAASRHFFQKEVADLTLGEAALLAALLKAPARFDPYSHPAKAKDRRDLVLGLMKEQKLAPGDEVDAALASGLGLRPGRAGRGVPGDVGAYFVEEVRRLLEKEFGDRLYTQRLKVYTTLDVDLQVAAEEELARQLTQIERGQYGRYTGKRYNPGTALTGSSTSYLQGAIVAMDVATGDVRAWVGGRDIRQSEFDRVSAAHRQAGSAFKPFVFAAALAQGVPLTRRLEDEPYRVQLARNQFWEPRNFSGDYSGRVTMRNALVRSVNVPTVHLAEEVGYRRITSLARSAGIESPIAETPAMALGTVAVSPLELTSAYTTFAGLGRHVAPRVVTRIENELGEVLRTFATDARDVMSPSVAYLINDTLHDALERGSGAPAMQAGFTGPAAGKTGTTSDGVDAWFIGYTSEIVAGVWIGFDTPKRIVAGASGGRLAAPAWGRMMNRYYGNTEPVWWPAPANVVEYDIDPESGGLLEEGCRPRWGAPTTEIFIRGTEPESICPESDDYEYTWFNMNDPGYGGDAAYEGSGDDEYPGDDAYPGDDGYGGDEEYRRDPREARGGDGFHRADGGDRADGYDRADGSRHAGRAADLDGGWIFEMGITDTDDPNLRNLTATWQVRLWVDGNDVHGSGEKIAEDGRRVSSDRRTSISLTGQVYGDRIRLRLTEYNGQGALSGWFNVDIEGRRLRGEFVSTDTATRGSVSARRS